MEASTAEGEMLVIVGTVYDSNCVPQAGASINAWQTDASGVYGPGHGGESLECCYFQGQVTTDKNGLYKLVTVMPGHYAGEKVPPPAHIHMEVNHAQAGGLMTEIVIAGDPSLEGTFGGDRIVVELEDAGDPDRRILFKRGFADIVLTGASGHEPVQAAASDGMRTFLVQPSRSQAAYHIQEKFMSLPIGVGATAVTDQVEGSIAVDLGDPQLLVAMDVKVDLASLKSDQENRDNKLDDDWLETRRFPEASFLAMRADGLPGDAASRAARGEALTFTLLGELTIHGVTQEVPFEVTAFINGSSLIGTATSQIKMTDFGIDPPNMLDFVVVEDEVDLTINIFATEPKAGG
jgi:polyisoprenoid-binding protein YceI